MDDRAPRNSRGPIVQLPSQKIGEYCRFGYGGNCSSKQGALIYPDPWWSNHPRSCPSRICMHAWQIFLSPIVHWTVLARRSAYVPVGLCLYQDALTLDAICRLERRSLVLTRVSVFYYLLFLVVLFTWRWTERVGILAWGGPGSALCVMNDDTVDEGRQARNW